MRSFNELFFKNLKRRSRRAARLSWLSLFINIVLAGVKFAVGLLAETYVLIADALESLLDVLSSAVVIGGLRYGSRRPDANHPFGHGKAESLSAFMVSWLILLAAGLVAVMALKEIMQRDHTPPKPLALWILIGVVVIKEGLFRILHSGARRFDKLGLKADAWHQRSDALTSFAALVGVTAARYGPPALSGADDWAALLMSGFIVWQGGRIMRAAVRDLMDEDVPRSWIESVRAVAAATPGVLAVEKCVARRSGSGYLVEIHIEVDGRLSVAEGHQIAHDVKARLFSTDLDIIDCVVHVEPHPPCDDEIGQDDPR